MYKISKQANVISILWSLKKVWLWKCLYHDLIFKVLLYGCVLWLCTRNFSSWMIHKAILWNALFEYLIKQAHFIYFYLENTQNLWDDSGYISLSCVLEKTWFKIPPCSLYNIMSHDFLMVCSHATIAFTTSIQDLRNCHVSLEIL